MLKKIVRAAIVASTVWVSAAPASAALLAADWVAGSGDAYLTRDTASGLTWLDVSLTAGQNYDDVRAGEWYARGFRHATRSEVERLFINAGTPDDGFDVSTTHVAQTSALIDLLGVTFATLDRTSTYGLIGTDFIGNDVNLASHPNGTPFSALLAKLDVIDFRPHADLHIGEAHFTGGAPFSDERDSLYGSFLVKPVPEPSTYALLAAGLLGLAARIRQRR